MSDRIEVGDRMRLSAEAAMEFAKNGTCLYEVEEVVTNSDGTKGMVLLRVQGNDPREVMLEGYRERQPKV